MQMDAVAKAALTKLLDKVPGSAQIFADNVEEELKAAPLPTEAALFSPGGASIASSLASPSGWSATPRSAASPRSSASTAPKTPTLSQNQRVPRNDPATTIGDVQDVLCADVVMLPVSETNQPPKSKNGIVKSQCGKCEAMKVDLDCHDFVMEEMERRETCEHDLTKVCDQEEESDGEEDVDSGDDEEEEEEVWLVCERQFKTD